MSEHSISQVYSLTTSRFKKLLLVILFILTIFYQKSGGESPPHKEYDKVATYLLTQLAITTQLTDFGLPQQILPNACADAEINANLHWTDDLT